MLSPAYKIGDFLRNSQGRKNVQLCTTSRKHDNKNGQPLGNTSESLPTSQSSEKDSSFCGLSEGIATESVVIAGTVGGVCGPNLLMTPKSAGASMDNGDNKERF